MFTESLIFSLDIDSAAGWVALGLVKVSDVWFVVVGIVLVLFRLRFLFSFDLIHNISDASFLYALML